MRPVVKLENESENSQRRLQWLPDICTVSIGTQLLVRGRHYLATKLYSILKMAHYMGVLSGTEEPSAIHPHTDYELLTILLQDTIPSLEVLSNTGKWIQARPIPGTFVVNIGDSMSMVTNGLSASTMHRVINSSNRDLYSVAFFLGGQYSAPPILRC